MMVGNVKTVLQMVIYKPPLTHPSITTYQRWFKVKLLTWKANATTNMHPINTHPVHFSHFGRVLCNGPVLSTPLKDQHGGWSNILPSLAKVRFLPNPCDSKMNQPDQQKKSNKHAWHEGFLEKICESYTRNLLSIWIFGNLPGIKNESYQHRHQVTGCLTYDPIGSGAIQGKHTGKVQVNTNVICWDQKWATCKPLADIPWNHWNPDWLMTGSLHWLILIPKKLGSISSPTANNQGFGHCSWIMGFWSSRHKRMRCINSCCILPVRQTPVLWGVWEWGGIGIVGLVFHRLGKPITHPSNSGFREG